MDFHNFVDKKIPLTRAGFEHCMDAEMAMVRQGLVEYYVLRMCESLSLLQRTHPLSDHE